MSHDMDIISTKCSNDEEKNISLAMIEMLLAEAKNAVIEIFDEQQGTECHVKINMIFQAVTMQLTQIHGDYEELKKDHAFLKIRFEELLKKQESMQMHLVDAYNQFARTIQS